MFNYIRKHGSEIVLAYLLVVIIVVIAEKEYYLLVIAIPTAMFNFWLLYFPDEE